LSPTQWGRGLAHEAAFAVLADAFAERHVASVWAATDPPNLASVALLERLGMTYQRRTRLDGGDVLVYAMTAERFAGGYVVRRARADEVPRLPPIETAASELLRAAAPAGDSLPLATSVAALAEACAGGRLWVAETSAGEVVGFVHVTLLAGQPHLEEIDVLPAHGRRGLGRAMLKTVIEWARQAGFAALTLTAFREVPWNAPFYRRLGFRDLDPAVLAPELEALVADEERRGLPRAQRVVMRLALDDTTA
jgi:RimJ/RimL family protein N-acetyltransferase